MRSEEGAEGLECVAWSWDVRLGCGRPPRASRYENQLTVLPESIGQLTALEVLSLSQASACAKLRCCCGPWTVEVVER